MSCNNIQDISANMCDKICSDNIPASNTELLNNCNSKCNEKILKELNPLDITNNFIFLNSADVAEISLEKAAETSDDLFNEKVDSMSKLIDSIERETKINNKNCGIKLGTKWIKIIDGDKNNEYVDINYIKTFKKYSAFGVKWKNIGKVKPNSKYVELVNGIDSSQGNIISQDSYNYLRNSLLNGIKDENNNILLKKKDLIDNGLFVDNNSSVLKIYPNSYIKLSDDSYCKVSNYDISSIDPEIKLRFNGRDDKLNFTTNDKLKDTFSNLTINDFIINNSGDIYIPSIGCSDFNDNPECTTISDVLTENCFADNKNNRYIKRKDTIPFIFDHDHGCINKALNFSNKSELYDIMHKITYDPLIIEELNEMMGRYDSTRYETIKNRINELLTDEYSQYFSTNDFLNLFDENGAFWINLDDDTFNYRVEIVERFKAATGSFDVGRQNDDEYLKTLNNYDKIAEVLSKKINESTPDNFLISLSNDELKYLKDVFGLGYNGKLESLVDFRDWFEIIHANGNSSKIVLYVPLYELLDNREDTYDKAVYANDDPSDLFKSLSGIDFYDDVSGNKTIESDLIGKYGQIGYNVGDYNNVILSDDYIKNTECENIKSRVLNTSNSIFITENIKNRFDLDKYKLNESDFENLTNELNTYNTNIDNLDKCIENSKSMIDLDTYNKTKEYNNIDNNIRENAEINKKYNIYLSKVNKYEDSDVNCKYLSEYNNLDTCGLPGETTEMCLSDDFVSDTQYDNQLDAKKDALKEYIFNRQKNYYVGKSTNDNKPKMWKSINTYPSIGLELLNNDLKTLLDDKFTSVDNIIVLSDDELSRITLNTNIDNNTYIKSSQVGRYYVVNLEQENCNQPDNYQLQNSENICGENKQCAYENEYTNSITNISQYDDNYCSNKFSNLEYCYNQDPSFDMGKQVNYDVCKDDQESSPEIIDCEQPVDPPECEEGGYISYKIEDDKFTCEQECGSCVPNTTLNISDNKCHANVGYYYDYDYDQLESTNPPVPEMCPDGSYIDVTGAKSESECNICRDECEADKYETVDCTFSTNRVCIDLPSNSTKSDNGKTFICAENYFKRGDQCVKCPDNTTSEEGSTSVLQCIAEPGYYFDPQRYHDNESLVIPTEASQCVGGTYCATGSTSETSCPSYTTSSAGSTDISQCYARPGYYYDHQQHNEGQLCQAGYYCPGGENKEVSGMQQPCPENTYNSLEQQVDETACLKCDYQTSSVSGSSECLPCEDLPIVASDRSAIRKYKYYDYKKDGCAESIIKTGSCSSDQLSEDIIPNDADCPSINPETNKFQFYGFTGEIERDTSGKPLLFYPDDASAPSTQDEIRNKLRIKDPDFGHEYTLGYNVDHRCVKSCISCEPNEVYIRNLSACDPCTENRVADNTGLNCVKCNERTPNTIYDDTIKNCVKCPEYYLPNFDTDLCDKPAPGYYVVCDDTTNTCEQVKADTNKIVLGQINVEDWFDNIVEIIFDYGTVSVPPGVTNNINIILKNVTNIEAISTMDSEDESTGDPTMDPEDEGTGDPTMDPEDESTGDPTMDPEDEGNGDPQKDFIFNLTKKSNKQEDKYFRDISQNIIVFENTSENNIPVKYLDSIYISSYTDNEDLPNKLIMKTNVGSYYLLTHSLKEDVTIRYYTETAWNKQIQDIKQFATPTLGTHNEEDDSLGSYLIFDINLNIRNEQYECPENTFIDDSTAVNLDGTVRGTNRNICKIYDAGFYRDIQTTEGFEDYSGGDTSSLSSDTTVESFTNFENFDTRIQTTCFNQFTPANIQTIDISESKLGAEAGNDYAGCIYKCKTDGHYYNEGRDGLDDNKCEPCPIGYKCDDKQNMRPCNGDNEYQNETGKQECKIIPTGGVAIKDSTLGIETNIGFTIPLGKQYTMADNTISDCPKDDFKDTTSNIDNINVERDISCTDCPAHTTTKELTGRTQLAECIPDFGYNLDTEDGLVYTLTGYDDSSGIIKCAANYYLGNFAGNCDELNPNRNECTECSDDRIDKACIPCPTGYTCSGGSVDCVAEDKAIPIIKPANIDNEPDFIIDSCWPGMKLVSGECQLCEYATSDSDKYCINGTAQNYVTKTSTDAIKLKNNDKFTPAVFITVTDNEKYNIAEITQDSNDTKNIIFRFNNNNIPFNIQEFSDFDIDSLKQNDVPLYLYEYASGEKSDDNKIYNATNVTQSPRTNISGNTIDLLNEGYITTTDTSQKIIQNKIINNDLKFIGQQKDYLLDIIKQYNVKKSNYEISQTMNLSYLYDLEYYNGTEYKTYTYVYRILPYAGQCDAGYETLTGLIDSCTQCPQGTYKSDASATRCVNATGNNYVGVNNLRDDSENGLAGISTSQVPDFAGIEILRTTEGGNYGYKISSGYSYTANPLNVQECGTGFSGEQLIQDNVTDNTETDYGCGNCPDRESYSSTDKIGLLRVETDSNTPSSSVSDCVIKVCDQANNYMNINDNPENFCKLKNCDKGYYFDDRTEILDSYGQGKCTICPEGHYCDGPTIPFDESDPPTSTTHPKNSCPVNTYNQNTGSSSVTNCTSCPDNTTTNGVTAASSISACISDEGYYFNPDTDTEATICPVRKYCPQNSITPTDCPANTTSAEGSVSYTDCRADPGWFYNYNTATIDTTATLCGEKSYCTGDNTQEVSCPNNTNTRTLGGKTSLSDCEADAGYYYDYTNTSHTHAQPCPAGTFNTQLYQTSLSSCVQCPQDTYSSVLASTQSEDCEPCPTNSSTALDYNGNEITENITGKTVVTDCKPYKMYQRDTSNDNLMILKTGHSLDSADVINCDAGYYFDEESGECQICTAGNYCIGGIAQFGVDGSAIEQECPENSTSVDGTTSVDLCTAEPGFRKKVYENGTFEFEKSKGVKVDLSGEVVFKSEGIVQCEPGYETKEDPNPTTECQICGDNFYSADGNECKECTSYDNENDFVLKECDKFGTDVIKIPKNILRIDSIDTDDIKGIDYIQSRLLGNTVLKVSDIYQLITPVSNSVPNYKYLSNLNTLYFIKIIVRYENLPITGTDNIYSKITPEHFNITNLTINNTTASYTEIIDFIYGKSDDELNNLNILDLCYFVSTGTMHQLYLLLPLCGCIPGTYLNGTDCIMCADNKFQPYFNHSLCYSIPSGINTSSYTITTTTDSDDIEYKTGVELNMGWKLDSSGVSTLCAANTFKNNTTDITQQIVDGSYTAFDCSRCPTGSETANLGSTDVTACEASFGYREVSDGSNTYNFQTGYNDANQDNIVDCTQGYYYNDQSQSCVQCPAGTYCIGGIAALEPFTNFENFSQSQYAITQNCPRGTYNSAIGSDSETNCQKITGNYYGTKEGAISVDDGFRECPENTSIDEESGKDSVTNCSIADPKYKTSLDSISGDLIVKLQDFYAEDTNGDIFCIPGTIKNTADDSCEDPGTVPANNYIDTDGGKVKDCSEVPSHYIELSTCDGYNNSIFANVSKVNAMTTMGGERFVQCIRGYEPIHFEDLDDSPDNLNFIDTVEDFYLYEYKSEKLDSLKTNNSIYSNDANFHFNASTQSEMKIRIENALNNNLQFVPNDKNTIKASLQSYYTIMKTTINNNYKLLYFKDVDVYNNSETPNKKFKKRYIYGILPYCNECPDGYTSTGAASSCEQCPIGSIQITSGEERICSLCNAYDVYQDEPGKTACKQLPDPTERDGYHIIQNSEGANIDFNIATGYKWIGGNTIQKCSRSQTTNDYDPNGVVKTNATVCTPCAANQVHDPSALDTCVSCPTTATDAYYLDYDTSGSSPVGTERCMSCATHYSGKDEAVGVTKWKLRSGNYIRAEYCAADTCDTPLYVVDPTTGYCKLNVCSNGQYFDKTRNGGKGECVNCEANTYCAGNRTIMSQGGNWYPAKTSCPAYTTSLSGSTALSNCTANAGYYMSSNGNSGQCPAGTYCPAGSSFANPCPANTESPAGSTTANQCVAKPGYHGQPGTNPQICPANYYCTGGNHKQQCPANTVSPTGSTSANQCVAKAGYYGTPGTAATICSAGTFCPGGGNEYWGCQDTQTSPAGSTTFNDCKPKSGYYGGIGMNIVYPCPGVTTDQDSTTHNITTRPSANSSLDHCVYGTCTSGYRDSNGRCTPFSSTSSANCTSDQVFVQGRASNNSSTFTTYTTGIEADYNTQSIYGHDNKCVDISSICAA